MVLVDDAAEESSSPYRCVDRDHHARIVVGRALMEALVWRGRAETRIVCYAVMLRARFSADLRYVATRSMGPTSWR